MHELSGVTLEDCLVSVIDARSRNRKTLMERRSSFLFTHFGFSGPAAMDISGSLTAAESFADREVLLDLLPGWDLTRLRQWLTDRLRDGGRQRVASRLATHLPMRLASALAQHVGADCTIAELPRNVCGLICNSLKQLPLNVHGTLGFDKAEVTAGGVALAEVDPRTMQSRLAAGLYIAGEVLDVDGPIGGYNFQAAFSTGRAAGIAAAQR
jgi:predicted Rossmann fold flavoprotein